jgi:2,4-dienoyl-CoA reductase-like NADH-dependent reductase (Old Yellow Enzyme family)
MTTTIEPLFQPFSLGKLNLLAVGRSLLVDPHWAQKARKNEAFLPCGMEAYGQLS